MRNRIEIEGIVDSIYIPDDCRRDNPNLPRILMSIRWERYPDGSHPVDIPVLVSRSPYMENDDLPYRAIQEIRNGMAVLVSGKADIIGSRISTQSLGIEADSITVIRTGRTLRHGNGTR